MVNRALLYKVCVIAFGGLLTANNVFAELTSKPTTRLSEEQLERLKQIVDQHHITQEKQLDEMSPTVYVITHSQVIVAGNEIIVSLGQDQTSLKFYVSLRDCNDDLMQSALSGKRALSVTKEQGFIRAEKYLERENDLKNYIYFQCTEMSHRP